MATFNHRPTITQFLVQEYRRVLAEKSSASVTGDFTSLMIDIVRACKTISMYVNKGPKLGVLGVADSANVQGEQQKALDVLSNEVFIQCNQWAGHVGGMVSEELDEFYAIPKIYPRGKYLLAFDPLDGSSNIEVNVSVGTIFSIFKAPPEGEEVTADSFLQAGHEMVAAGYCLYGPQTTLVLSTGRGVNAFTLDQDVGEFILSTENMRVPPTCGEYSINQSNRRHWDPPVLRYVEGVEAGKSGPRGKDYTMRWCGSMVADVHRILTRGGIFLYPLDAKLRREGKTGRLRYLYEVAPMAFLIEAAGGRAIDGFKRVLEHKPTHIHERTSCILGSKEEVDMVEKFHQEWQAELAAAKATA